MKKLLFFVFVFYWVQVAESRICQIKSWKVKDDNGNFNVTVSMDTATDYLRFHVEAEVPKTHYIALGISEDPFMAKSDIYLAHYEEISKAVVLSDRYVDSKSMPYEDQQQDAEILSSGYTNNKMFLYFKRKRVTTDSQWDISIPRNGEGPCVYLLFACGRYVTSPSYHYSKRWSSKDSNIDVCATCSDASSSLAFGSSAVAIGNRSTTEIPSTTTGGSSSSTTSTSSPTGGSNSISGGSASMAFGSSSSAIGDTSSTEIPPSTTTTTKTTTTVTTTDSSSIIPQGSIPVQGSVNKPINTVAVGRVSTSVGKPCVDPGEIANATRVIYTNTTVKYTCDSGVLKSGNLTRKCKTDGTWTGSPPHCVNPCPNPAVFKGSSLQTKGPYKIGDSIQYTCDYGHRLRSGHIKRTCKSDSTWSGSTPVCQLIKCRVPANVPNTNAIIYGLNFGNNVKYSCRNGYVYESGSLTRTCNKDGSWSGKTPICNKELGPMTMSREELLQCKKILENELKKLHEESKPSVKWTLKSFIQRRRSKGVYNAKLRDCLDMAEKL